MQHNPSALSEGSVFHGRYRIVRCLTAGGMGAVYECVHLATEKHRALKVMLPEILATPGMRERFELEARITAKIESDHIVETFDAGIDTPSGAPFLVMELLRGEDLERTVMSRGGLPPQEVLVLLAQAALALDKTHAAGIVHRDLKPQNMFLTTRDDGSPRLKILDFGIAKVVADGANGQKTAAVGTPVFMAPEQTTGDGAIGPAADLYALGHIAYALLTGHAYWAEDQLELPMYRFLQRMLGGVVEPASQRAARHGAALPAAFDVWFARATATSPSDRFPSATAQVRELAGVLGFKAPRLSMATPAPITDASRSPPTAVPALSAPPAAMDDTPLFAPPPELLEALAKDAVAEQQRPSEQPAAHTPPPQEASRTASVGPIVALSTDTPAAIPARSKAWLVGVGGLVAAAVMVAALVTTMRPSEPTATSDRGSPKPTASSAASYPETTGAPTVTPAPEVSVNPATAEPQASAASASSEPPRKVLPRPPAAKPVAAKAPSCSPPFTVDATGVKHAKPECL